VLSLAGQLYLPHALQVGVEHFGAFGLAFALIGWLFVLGFVLIVATVLGAVIVQDEGVEGLVLAVRRRVASLFRPRSKTAGRDDPGDAPADH